MIPMKKVLLFLFALLLLIACGGDDAGGGEGPSGGNEYLNVADISIPTGNTTATMYIKASANCEWTITCDESWISFSEKSGRGDLNVSVTVTANPSSTDSREALVTVSSKAVSRTITITQAPNSESLDISPSSMSFTSTAESKDVTISSNTHWTVTGGANWITLDKTEGNNDGTVTISVLENESNEPRNAEIVFKTPSVTKQLSIQQAGAPSTVVDGISIPQVEEIDKHSAIVSFEYNYQQTISSYGLCYSTSGDPTTESSRISEDAFSSKGTPTIEISGLSSATTYYVRAYVIISGVVQYSATTQFTTLSSQPGGDDNITPSY